MQRCHLVVGAYAHGAGSEPSSECRRAVIHWLVAGGYVEPEAWLGHELDWPAIEAAWTDFARRHAPAVGLAPLPTAPAEHVPDARPEPGTLAALETPRRVPAGWRIGSYSGLTRGVRHEGAAIDHDAHPGAAAHAAEVDLEAGSALAADVDLEASAGDAASVGAVSAGAAPNAMERATALGAVTIDASSGPTTADVTVGSIAVASTAAPAAPPAAPSSSASPARPRAPARPIATAAQLSLFDAPPPSDGFAATMAAVARAGTVSPPIEAPSPTPGHADALAGSDLTAGPPLAADDILHFPRGIRAGDCLHALLERVDYDDPSGWSAAIDAVLREWPQPGADPQALPPMLTRMLRDVLHAPLPAGLRLAELPRARRLVELEFHLPVDRLDESALAATLRTHGQPVPALSFGALQGFLRGFIDLVFEHGGRYFVLDWKSNHLGAAPADYAGPALERAMDAHGYRLQALLYTLALHRHLSVRVPGYRYDEHIGGALYVFVRGLRPGWRADGAPCVVHLQRPPFALIQALSALLGPAPGAAP
jgi:ATP-dependent exoDNAse (exonuclease V) beta subunit